MNANIQMNQLLVKTVLEVRDLSVSYGKVEALSNANIRVGEGQIVRRHAWRLSLKPVLALGGLAMAALLGGAFVVETIAAWPGLGRLTYDALRARDIPLVAGCAVAGSTVLAVGLFVSEVLTALADPRVRIDE